MSQLTELLAEEYELENELLLISEPETKVERARVDSIEKQLDDIRVKIVDIVKDYKDD